MLTNLPRTDSSVIGRWWWTVDRWTLLAVALLVGYGAILIVAASPPVAERIGLPEFHFVRRHLVMLAPALAVMLAVSLLSARGIRRLAFVLCGGAFVGVLLTLVVGPEIKGATRWLQLPGISIQPSEFLKPGIAVMAAWLFAQHHQRESYPGYLVATALWLAAVALVLMQPDLGMAVVITAMWGIQFFLAGLPMILVVLLAMVAVGGLFGSYFMFDHVASRIDRFLDPSSGDSYQIERSLEAFQHGGVWGTGPGEGIVKHLLPDAHADFIFAVAGEEFGLLWCLLLVGLFGFVVLRGFARIHNDGNLFVLLATAGLLTQFGLQALVNMGSTLHLIPTKGMTMPFVSYGGSSLLATGLTIGMVLALTRRRAGAGANP